jgi:hypothetical protein
LSVEGLTFGLAIIGAVLGILNTWHAISQSKPKMRVRMLHTYSTPKVELVGFSIDVTNLSSFALTVTEVGFSLSPWWRRDIERLYLNQHKAAGHDLPVRLEPRQSASFYFQGKMEGRPPKKITAAYAKTDCGVYFRGTTPALKQLSRQMRLD